VYGVGNYTGIYSHYAMLVTFAVPGDDLTTAIVTGMACGALVAIINEWMTN
jgi:hypothetical protein